jgi:hypothetical protein
MAPHCLAGTCEVSATIVKVLTESVGPSVYLGQFSRWAGPVFLGTPAATMRSTSAVVVALAFALRRANQAACTAGRAANFPPIITRR